MLLRMAGVRNRALLNRNEASMSLEENQAWARRHFSARSLTASTRDQKLLQALARGTPEERRWRVDASAASPNH